MLSLTPALLAHQQSNARRPAVAVTAIAGRQFGATVPVFRWNRWYTGAEAATPHAAAVAADGSLVRARVSGAQLYIQRVAAPTSSSTFSAWAALAAVTAGSYVALAAQAGELLLIVGDNTALKRWASSDNGASWSGPTTIVTEASAIGPVAAAFNPFGDACAFYALGTSGTTLKRLRRTSGAWAGSGTNWSRAADTATINGLAACHDGADFALAITGTAASTTARTVWACRMGDTLLPTNVWSGLNTIAQADSASTTTFAAPSIASINGTSAIAYVRIEAGNAAFTDAELATSSGTVADPFSLGAPLGMPGSTGMALTLGPTMAEAFACSPSAVWRAPVAAATALTARLLALRLRLRPYSLDVTAEFDNHDGALLSDAALFTGASLSLRFGYHSGALGAAEYGLDLYAAIDQIRYERHADRNVATARCSGAWEQLSASPNWEPYAVAAGAAARSATAYRIAGRARVDLGLGPAASWNDTPAFVWAPGESAAAALRRIAEPVADLPTPAGDTMLWTATGPADASAYAYGPTAHPITAGALTDAPPPSNWARAIGPDRYADDRTTQSASIHQHGPRIAMARDLYATSDALAISHAAAIARRAAVLTPRGELAAPANVGQQLYDVVTVTDAALGASAHDYRVIGLGIDYQRGGSSKRARYDSILELGGL